MARTIRAMCAILLVAVALLSSGCSLSANPQAHIHGKVYVDHVTTTDGNHLTQAVGPATVECNGNSAHAGNDGVYSLGVDIADGYDCKVSAGGSYIVARATVPSALGKDIVLDFGPVAGGTCDTPGKNHMICPSLHLRPGSLTVSVTSALSSAAVAGTTVKCWDPDIAGQMHQVFSDILTATTDASGSYAFSGVVPGPYTCRAGNDYILHRTLVPAGGSARLSFGICITNCPVVVNAHSGVTLTPAVMHDLIAYLVFWLPPGATFEPGGSDTRFETLMENYFQDVGGTLFNNIVTQYWDYEGYASNSVSLGGSYVDTTPYPRSGTRTQPLYDLDLQYTIDRAVAKNNWQVTPNSAFFIFTGYGIQECFTSDPRSLCTFNHVKESFAGWHSTYDLTQETIYSYIGDVFGTYQGPIPSPNGDPLADAVLDVVSHEHFETVTDPFPGRGWYDTLSTHGEIGDKCESAFGPRRANGANVTLNHGHSYLLQAEWSNAAHGCALSYQP